jgi:hypothetical protein
MKTWRNYLNKDGNNNIAVSTPPLATKRELVKAMEVDLSKQKNFEKLYGYLNAKFSKDDMHELFGEDLGRLMGSGEITHNEAVNISIARIVANTFREFQSKGFCHFCH